MISALKFLVMDELKENSLSLKIFKNGRQVLILFDSLKKNTHKNYSILCEKNIQKSESM